MVEDNDVTRLLERMSSGDDDALNELTPIVYEELHRIAERQFRRENRNVTLQATAILNEAYLRLVDASVEWNDRRHFFAISARIMRRIIVDHAKARRAAKRGGGAMKVTFQESAVAGQQVSEDVLALEEAMLALQEANGEQAEIVELHFFGGLTYDEIGEIREMSAATVKRKLRFAKAWINRFLADLEQD